VDPRRDVAVALGETWVFLALYLGFFAVLVARRRASDDARPALGAGAAILAVLTLLAQGRSRAASSSSACRSASCCRTRSPSRRAPT